MKALVFSDSHRNIKYMREVLDMIGEKAQIVIHLGDNVEDAKAIETLYPYYQHYAVSGNCDPRSSLREKQLLELSGCKILLTHGHLYGVKSDYVRIAYAAQEAGVQLCLFGHTHVPVTFTQAGISFMNPGSIFLPRQTGFYSYGVIDLEAGRCTVVGKIGGLYRPVDVEMGADL